jgi:AbrB family looped-hinge helix DNA binding protein
MGELLKLKVSPKGQITLPKRVRKEMVIKDFIYLEVKGNKAILKPVTFEEEFEDLIVRELEYEGYSKVQIDEMLPEKKKDLSKAILEELESRKDEETITHEELIKELE